MNSQSASLADRSPCAALSALSALSRLSADRPLSRHQALRRHHRGQPRRQHRRHRNHHRRVHRAWNGIYRTIPVEYHTPQGFNWTLRLELQGATDQSGNRLKVESARERHYIKYKIWVPGAKNATRTIVLHYRAQNGLRFFADHDELYWNVTGDEWDVPIEAASARIELPASGDGSPRDRVQRRVRLDGARRARSTRRGHGRSASPCRKPLGFHEGLTAVVGWDKGAVVEPTTTDEAVGFSGQQLAARHSHRGVPRHVHPLGQGRARSPARSRSWCSTSRPDGLTPAEAGTLVDYHGRHAGHHGDDGGPRGAGLPQDRGAGGEQALRAHEGHRVRLPSTRAAGGSARALEPHEQRVLDGIFGIAGRR